MWSVFSEIEFEKINFNTYFKDNSEIISSKSQDVMYNFDEYGIILMNTVENIISRESKSLTKKLESFSNSSCINNGQSFSFHF